MQISDSQSMRLQKSSSVLWLFVLLLGSIVIKADAQLMNLSDLPLTVKNDVAPNLVVTLDDSGSMSWGYMPDRVSSHRYRNYYRSSHFNTVYYDPAVEYEPPRNADGSRESDADFSSAVRGFYNSLSSRRFTRNLNTSFAAITSHSYNGYLYELDGRYTAYGCSEAVCRRQAAYYYAFHGSSTVNGSCTTNSSQKNTDEDCYSKVVITDSRQYDRAGNTNQYGRTMGEEKTNFANWYQYYSTRADASKTAMMRAFIPDNVSSNVRVGRQAINQRTSTNHIRSGSDSANNEFIAALTDSERSGFYSWLKNVGTSGSTPLRRSVYRAGEYFRSSNAYYDNPENNSGEILGCRVNTHVLVTDGFYNGGSVLPANFKSDQSSFTLPDGTAYRARPPYVNTNDSSGLADLAFHYWATDLHPLPNNIEPFASSAANTSASDYWHPKNDPATWQHMNTFAIAFGAEGTISTDDATYQRLLSGQQRWPRSVRNTPTTIDDLYHSAINGRGDFFNAGNPQELVDALKAITDRLGERKGKAPSVGATSGRISSDTNIYIASFDTDSWSGDLAAFEMSDGSDFAKPGATGCNSKPVGTRCGEASVWSAADRNGASDAHIEHTQRTIFTYNPEVASVGSRGTPFLWSGNLTAAQRAQLNQSDGMGIERLDYLRGDGALEEPNGVFRARVGEDGGAASRVGAIVHSNPVYVGPGDAKLQFRFPDDLEASAYRIGSREPVVYVGANDGMLHAYNAKDGRERFAYVPNLVFENLHELTSPGFTHRSYVDGLLDYQDAFINGQWRSLLAGGLRKGGQGYFMLDVTNPPNNNSANANGTVMWEFGDEEDADIGYTYGKPAIIKSNYRKGEWIVLVSSGYNSTENDGRQGSGEAFLYALSAANGQVIAKIGVGGDATNPNGLSSLVAVSDADVDNFGDGVLGTDIDAWVADYAYAGDVQGKLWKFDLSSTNPADWKAILLFDAGTDQAITASPSVGSYPASGPSGYKENRYVYFGTGKFIEPSDTVSSERQAFYALIDDDRCSSKNTPCVSASQLVTQSISKAGILSNNTFDLNQHKGCELDLSASKAAERVISASRVIADNVIFSTMTPNGSGCSAKAESALYALNRFTCGQTAGQILDTNGDGEISSLDQLNDNVVSTIEFKGSEINIFSGANDYAIGSPEDSTAFDPQDRSGRVRWRQIK